MGMKSRLTEQEKDFIQAMAESNLKFVRAARKVGLNNSEAEKLSRRITNKTGLLCRKFYDLIKLLSKMEEL